MSRPLRVALRTQGCKVNLFDQWELEAGLRKASRPVRIVAWADEADVYVVNTRTVTALGSDIICGFPGEDDQAWADTRELCTDIGFSYLHAFPYSRRPMTDAAHLKDDVPHDTKRARVRELVVWFEGPPGLSGQTVSLTVTHTDGPRAYGQLLGAGS